MKIGYSISTTPKRYDSQRNYFENCTPDGVYHLHNDTQYLGMATAKNRGIKYLYDEGCDYIILMDDDTKILRPDFGEWIVGAMKETDIQHLIYPFKNSSVVRNIQFPNYTIEQVNHGAGVLLCITREVVEKVGYLSTNYPAKWGHIHIGWSRRIHRSGLMPGCKDWRVSVKGIKKYFWSADIDGNPEVQNFSQAEQNKMGKLNMPSLVAEDKEPIYKPFSEA